MSETERIIDQLEREHEGDPWHGSPLRRMLEGISAKEAASRPVAGAHSIWELVLHITAWKNEIRRRLSGAPAGDPEEGDWPPVGPPSEDGWRDTLARLEHAQAELVEAIRRFPEPRLSAASNDPRNRPTGTGVSYYVLLHGAVQHDVYHSGQIAILKKALLQQ